MRHRNSVRQLGRTYSHRKAMFNNMVTSLFENERIITTKQKGKELKKISEKLITRAKKNLELTDKDAAKKLHNKREVMKVIKNRDIVKKLFDDIAPRFKDRKGGFTRLYLLGRRQGDSAEMSLVELVEKQASKVKKEDNEKTKAAPDKKVAKGKSKDKKEEKQSKGKKEKKEVKETKSKKATKDSKDTKATKDTKEKKAKAKETETKKEAKKPKEKKEKKTDKKKKTDK